ncbi:MAG: hypothetical protein V3S16_05930 [Candidatus Desulfatibia sp.]|uniref:hypothetical protein n=1 Tax=Candidatus Desulfatibia sp. TaxID=3101189 RepID=UPI002F2ED7FD
MAENISKEFEELSNEISALISKSSAINSITEKLKVKQLVRRGERVRIVFLFKGSNMSLHGPFVEICKNIDVPFAEGLQKEEKDELSDVIFMEW